MSKNETLSIVATGLPNSIEDYQLALNAAFAGGKAYGSAKVQHTFENSCYTEKDIEDACKAAGVSDWLTHTVIAILIGYKND